MTKNFFPGKTLFKKFPRCTPSHFIYCSIREFGSPGPNSQLHSCVLSLEKPPRKWFSRDWILGHGFIFFFFLGFRWRRGGEEGMFVANYANTKCSWKLSFPITEFPYVTVNESILGNKDGRGSFGNFIKKK